MAGTTFALGDRVVVTAVASHETEWLGPLVGQAGTLVDLPAFGLEHERDDATYLVKFDEEIQLGPEPGLGTVRKSIAGTEWYVTKIAHLTPVPTFTTVEEADQWLEQHAPQ